MYNQKAENVVERLRKLHRQRIELDESIQNVSSNTTQRTLNSRIKKTTTTEKSIKPHIPPTMRQDDIVLPSKKAKKDNNIDSDPISRESKLEQKPKAPLSKRTITNNNEQLNQNKYFSNSKRNLISTKEETKKQLNQKPPFLTGKRNISSTYSQTNNNPAPKQQSKVSNQANRNSSNINARNKNDSRKNQDILTKRFNTSKKSEQSKTEISNLIDSETNSLHRKTNNDASIPTHLDTKINKKNEKNQYVPKYGNSRSNTKDNEIASYDFRSKQIDPISNININDKLNEKYLKIPQDSLTEVNDEIYDSDELIKQAAAFLRRSKKKQNTSNQTFIQNSSQKTTSLNKNSSQTHNKQDKQQAFSWGTALKETIGKNENNNGPSAKQSSVDYRSKKHIKKDDSEYSDDLNLFFTPEKELPTIIKQNKPKKSIKSNIKLLDESDSASIADDISLNSKQIKNSNIYLSTESETDTEPSFDSLHQNRNTSKSKSRDLNLMKKKLNSILNSDSNEFSSSTEVNRPEITKSTVISKKNNFDSKIIDSEESDEFLENPPQNQQFSVIRNSNSTFSSSGLNKGYGKVNSSNLSRFAQNQTTNNMITHPITFSSDEYASDSKSEEITINYNHDNNIIKTSNIKARRNKNQENLTVDKIKKNWLSSSEDNSSTKSGDVEELPEFLIVNKSSKKVVNEFNAIKNSVLNDIQSSDSSINDILTLNSSKSNGLKQMNPPKLDKKNDKEMTQINALYEQSNKIGSDNINTNKGDNYKVEKDNEINKNDSDNDQDYEDDNLNYDIPKMKKPPQPEPLITMETATSSSKNQIIKQKVSNNISKDREEKAFDIPLPQFDGISEKKDNEENHNSTLYSDNEVDIIETTNANSSIYKPDSNNDKNKKSSLRLSPPIGITYFSKLDNAAEQNDKFQPLEFNDDDDKSDDNLINQNSKDSNKLIIEEEEDIKEENYVSNSVENNADTDDDYLQKLAQARNTLSKLKEAKKSKHKTINLFNNIDYEKKDIQNEDDYEINEEDHLEEESTLLNIKKQNSQPQSYIKRENDNKEHLLNDDYSDYEEKKQSNIKPFHDNTEVEELKQFTINSINNKDDEEEEIEKEKMINANKQDNPTHDSFEFEIESKRFNDSKLNNDNKLMLNADNEKEYKLDNVSDNDDEKEAKHSGSKNVKTISNISNKNDNFDFDGSSEKEEEEKNQFATNNVSASSIKKDYYEEVLRLNKIPSTTNNNGANTNQDKFNNINEYEYEEEEELNFKRDLSITKAKESKIVNNLFNEEISNPNKPNDYKRKIEYDDNTFDCHAKNDERQLQHNEIIHNNEKKQLKSSNADNEKKIDYQSQFNNNNNIFNEEEDEEEENHVTPSNIINDIKEEENFEMEDSKFNLGNEVSKSNAILSLKKNKSSTLPHSSVTSEKSDNSKLDILDNNPEEEEVIINSLVKLNNEEEEEEEPIDPYFLDTNNVSNNSGSGSNLLINVDQKMPSLEKDSSENVQSSSINNKNEINDFEIIKQNFLKQEYQFGDNQSDEDDNSFTISSTKTVNTEKSSKIPNNKTNMYKNEEEDEEEDETPDINSATKTINTKGFVDIHSDIPNLSRNDDEEKNHIVISSINTIKTKNSVSMIANKTILNQNTEEFEGDNSFVISSSNKNNNIEKSAIISGKNSNLLENEEEEYEEDTISGNHISSSNAINSKDPISISENKTILHENGEKEIFTPSLQENDIQNTAISSNKIHLHTDEEEEYENEVKDQILIPHEQASNAKSSIIIQQDSNEHKYAKEEEEENNEDKTENHSLLSSTKANNTKELVIVPDQTMYLHNDEEEIEYEYEYEDENGNPIDKESINPEIKSALHKGKEEFPVKDKIQNQDLSLSTQKVNNEKAGILYNALPLEKTEKEEENNENNSIDNDDDEEEDPIIQRLLKLSSQYKNSDDIQSISNDQKEDSFKKIPKSNILQNLSDIEEDYEEDNKTSLEKVTDSNKISESKDYNYSDESSSVLDFLKQEDFLEDNLFISKNKDRAKQIFTNEEIKEEIKSADLNKGSSQETNNKPNESMFSEEEVEEEEIDTNSFSKTVKITDTKTQVKNIKNEEEEFNEEAIVQRLQSFKDSKFIDNSDEDIPEKESDLFDKKSIQNIDSKDQILMQHHIDENFNDNVEEEDISDDSLIKRLNHGLSLLGDGDNNDDAEFDEDENIDDVDLQKRMQDLLDLHISDDDENEEEDNNNNVENI